MTKTVEVIKDIRTLCNHTFEGGHRCASPALQHEAFCYYHHPTRKPVRNPTRRRSRRQSFNLPLPSGHSNPQRAVYEVIRRLAANQISTRHAGLILNALHNATQKVSENSHRGQHRSMHDKILTMSDFIPKPNTQKIGGLGPKAARLQALREKAAKANNESGKTAHADTANTAKANTSSHKKTAFQRKAT